MYIQDLAVSKADYIKLGLICAKVCQALNQGMDRRRGDEPSQPVLMAIERLTT
jgi:hypothetical protein